MNHFAALSSPAPGASPRAELHHGYRSTRQMTERLASVLAPEDQVVQSMPDVSPTKWHLAHTTWLFETFLLLPFLPGYRIYNENFGFLFNSYYEAVGQRCPRAQRGLLSRPTVTEVLSYRAHVDAAMTDLIGGAEGEGEGPVALLVQLGIHHEQQHQELLLTDILHVFRCNPLRPAYQPKRIAPLPRAVTPMEWVEFPAGVYEIGHEGPDFAFDNEGPRHEVLLRSFRLASRPVTNGEWRAFIEDGGYQRPELWLSDGWAIVSAEGWQAPLYWEQGSGAQIKVMTLHGLQALDEDAPVSQISLYEADAYARWARKRLPTEAEWEIAAADLEPTGNTLGSGVLQPTAAADAGAERLLQMFGDVWEWTASPYCGYPGYRPMSGAIGEYNGKFMCNQMVLRGGSCVTPDGHIRASYRNFFYPHQRWQFTGVRLAEDA